jgi:hypothetical protein
MKSCKYCNEETDNEKGICNECLDYINPNRLEEE